MAKFGQGGGRIFFCALHVQIKTHFACELTRCARANTRFAHGIFRSYFHNFMFLKILLPAWVKSCSRPCPWLFSIEIFGQLVRLFVYLIYCCNIHRFHPSETHRLETVTRVPETSRGVFFRRTILISFI